MTIPDQTAITQWDADDPLASVRDEFVLPDGLIYLDGNSLGPLPKATRQRMLRLLDVEWGVDLIGSWNTHDWFQLPETTGARIAGLIGAAADEVIVADSTSVNLFKLLTGALKMQAGRSKLLGDRGDFPTNLYVAQGVANYIPYLDLKFADTAKINSQLDDNTAVVSLNHISYRTGEIRDMQKITEQIQAAGALVIWDLCHSAGVYPVELDECNADFAVGCGYKYLNGGPGAPSFVYVAKRHHAAMSPAICGWMGHADPFTFNITYHAVAGMRRNLSGTPPILSLAALDAGLEILERVNMQVLRNKSKRLGDLFIVLTDAIASQYNMELISPRNGEQRGSQVALAHVDGYAIIQALIARGVVGDFRAPAIMRFGFSPLYTRYIDVWHAANHLRQVLESNEWKKPEFAARQAVT